MSQATLDVFVKSSNSCVDKQAAEVAGADNESGPALPAPSSSKRASKGATGAVRLQAGGTASVLGLVEAARRQDARARVVLVTLSWPHCDACGCGSSTAFSKMKAIFKSGVGDPGLSCELSLSAMGEGRRPLTMDCSV